MGKEKVEKFSIEGLRNSSDPSAYRMRYYNWLDEERKKDKLQAEKELGIK